jgi:sulfatase modifying factor 1
MAVRFTRVGAASIAAFTLTATFALAQDAGAPPPQSQDQVNHALAQIAPAFAGKNRFVATGGPGSIEAAIAAHVPTVFHSVDEGTLAAPKPNAKCPAEMALSGGGRFCIDRYECAVDEKMPDGSSKPHAIFEPLASGHTYVAKSAPNVTPQAYVSGASALLACTNAGKRLCAPVEWRAACGGSNGYAFPYGPTRVPKKCHDTGKAPMLVFHASSLATGFSGIELNDPRNDQLPDTIAKTGSSPDCVTDEGVFDMVGNLDEWTADPNGTFQGGYWLDTSQHGDGCAYRTIAHEFAYHDYSLGFRCCADPI